VRTPRSKLILDLAAGDRVVRRRLFDLASDPAELDSQASREPALAEELGRALFALHQEASGGREPLAPRGLDELTSEALRALGYLRD
jgi:hypothetical protein